MKNRKIEYKISELQSLQDRITKLTDGLYKLVDLCQDRGQTEAAHNLKLDLYFLQGMGKLMDVLITSPTKVYPRLHEETVAAEQTIHRSIFKEKFDAN